MKKILAPIDFSAASRTSSDYAAMLAKTFGAQLVLLHAYMEPLVIEDVIPDLYIGGQELHDEKREAVLTEAKYLSRKHLIVAEGDVRMGFPSQVIRDTIRRENTDLVVMGVKKSASARKIPGSTMTATLGKINVPVMAVPEGFSFTPFRHITLATDYKFDTDMFCLFLLRELIRRFDASLKVLNIRNKRVHPQPLEMAEKRGINNLLDKSKLEYFDLPNHNVEQGILDFVSTSATDLLVVIAHHHTIFGRMFVQHLSPALSHDTPVPLLVLKDTHH